MLRAMGVRAGVSFKIREFMLRLLVLAFAMFALAGCIPAATGPGSVSSAPDLPDDTRNTRDRGGNGSGGDM
jgi:hypothetical protein